MLINEASVLESNITAGGHYSLSLMSDLNTYLRSGARFDRAQKPHASRLTQVAPEG